MIKNAIINFFMEWGKKRKENRIFHRELHKEFHKKQNELYKNNVELQMYRKHVKYSRIIITLLNLVIWFLIFKYFGIKTISVFFAVLISLGAIIQLIFLMTLEKRIFKPISQLEKGVEEISKGNYDVNIESNYNTEINNLIDSFNDMAKKLKEGERLKAEYEENRKTLIANISHDLKTPITSIQGYIETLLELENMPKENINKYYKIIHNNAAYINKLIDDLFLFSKLDIQKLELYMERVEVIPFMEDLMQEFKFELEDRGIELYYNYSIKEKCYVEVDGKRVNQIFKNIIGNAVKYGKESNLKINVCLYKNKDHICIEIEDNGIGIPEDKLEHIFERFYRVDYERTKDLMSTGLGLAIAKELVEAQGGSIAARSVENKGTTFIVKFPIKE